MRFPLKKDIFGRWRGEYSGQEFRLCDNVIRELFDIHKVEQIDLVMSKEDHPQAYRVDSVTSCFMSDLIIEGEAFSLFRGASLALGKLLKTIPPPFYVSIEYQEKP